MFIDPYIIGLKAFFLVAVLIPVARFVAPKIGLTDAPGGRKDHEGHIPLVGGRVIFPVFIMASL